MAVDDQWGFGPTVLATTMKVLMAMQTASSAWYSCGVNPRANQHSVANTVLIRM